MARGVAMGEGGAAKWAKKMSILNQNDGFFAFNKF